MQVAEVAAQYLRQLVQVAQVVEAPAVKAQVILL
jgi:hypothetical protein